MPRQVPSSFRPYAIPLPVPPARASSLLSRPPLPPFFQSLKHPPKFLLLSHFFPSPSPVKTIPDNPRRISAMPKAPGLQVLFPLPFLRGEILLSPPPSLFAGIKSHKAAALLPWNHPESILRSPPCCPPHPGRVPEARYSGKRHPHWQKLEAFPLASRLNIHSDSF